MVDHKRAPKVLYCVFMMQNGSMIQGQSKWMDYLRQTFVKAPQKCTLRYLVHKQNYLNAT